MSTIALLGAAGTGKTTRLMTELEAHLASAPLEAERRVLALTRMHGSRHRLNERLGETSARKRFDCTTFDRFAWELAGRWRSLLREAGTSEPTAFDYDGTCDAGARVLGNDAAAKWVSSRYPVVVVDEFQDCRGGRLNIVQALAQHTKLLVAADEFQDLGGTGQSEAVVWLRSSATVTELSNVHRTSDKDLLAMAHAFRNGTAVPSAGRANYFSAPSHNAAAGYLARGIAWSGGDDVVVLSAATADNPWVRQAMERLAEKPIGTKGKQHGPYKVPWEEARERLEAALCAQLGLQDDDAVPIVDPRFGAGASLPGQREVERWIDTQRSLRGARTFSTGELRVRVRRGVQHLRAHGGRLRGLRAMTIHQAKNREFDRVLILWPLGVPKDLEVQRRLLYNAVTRAKKGATIIVQDPHRDRLSEPPFAQTPS